MLEKGFYRPAFFLHVFLKAFRFGFINHSWTRSANQTFGPGED